MTATGEATVTRVTSRDGTEIGYWTSGEGPPLVLVHGVLGDHMRWAPLLPHLEPHATVHAMDRRGRGASADGSRYAVAREFEDVAAVIDAVAGQARSPVDLLGHSLGANCALGGAALTANVRRLVLYEPALSHDPAMQAPTLVQRLEGLLADGRPEAAVETFLREALGMSDAQIDGYRALPSWQGRVAAARSLPRELWTVEGLFDPAAAARVTAPTLMVLGGDSPAFVKHDTETFAGALPDARVLVLEGHGHLADALAPQVFAPPVLEFLRDPAPSRATRRVG